MLDADWRVQTRDGVCLVAVVVRNATPVPRRVRVVHRLDGPPLPPRERGVPERGWDDDEYEGVVPAGDRLAVGFAARCDPREPPVAVTDEGRADPERTVDGPLDDAPTADGVARALPSPAPPRDAVPAADAVGASGETGEGSQRIESAGEHVPPTVTAWLDAVADRAERAERLATARDLDAAADAVAAAGGLDGVESLVADLAADAAALRAVAERADALAADCEARADVPVEAYRQLA